ncbi:hypothetical protein HYDPIDRAFT_111660 [Hydnomerulius pinastri MD-312]|uniref:DUF6534 domain-containing protein n=1 Tax=Hydnomerulius pinastri MD-312 TaxID=994086 RepID=A0A0C9VH65_9AGAM|nr:hypothetical protein HYDPIDRAFT_111660 [Hydnomerulius pinastri MD-312]
MAQTLDITDTRLSGSLDLQTSVLPNYDLSIGPTQVGVVLASILFGGAIVQTFTYYKKFPRDHWILQSLFAFEICLSIPHLACAAAAVWRTTVSNYSEPASLVILPQPASIAIILSAPIAFCVEFFFIFRLYKLSQKLVLPAFCVFFALVQLGFTITLGVAGYNNTNLLSFEAQWGWLLTSVLGISPTCALMITIGLSYQLYKMRKNGLKRTQRFLDRMIFYTIDTGLIISLVSIVEAFCPLMMQPIFPYCFKFCIVTFPVVSGLYLNSLLAALNSRAPVSEPKTPEAIIQFGTLASGRSDINKDSVTGLDSRELV